MSQEARTIRPFVELGGVGSLVNDAVLHFGDLSCLPNSRVAFDAEAHTFAMRPVKIAWAANDAEFMERRVATSDSVRDLGFSATDVSLVAIATTPYLRTAEVAMAISLTQLDDLPRVSSLTVNGRPRAFDASHHGFSVGVYILLNRNVEPRPLQPSRKGTWLARSQFTIVTDAAQTLFRLSPMNAAKKEQLGLGPRAVRYLDLDDHDPLEPFADQADKPEFFVDEQILTQLNLAARTPSSKAMQLQLAVDFIASVVTAASRHPEIKRKSLDDVEDSLLHRVIRASAGPGAREDDLKHLFSRVSDDPGWVVAHAENTLDIRSGVMANLQGDGG